MAIKISGVTIIDDSRNIVSGAAATFTSNVTIGGTLTYEDVTNIDSIGIITARSGIKLPDNSKIKLGDGDEFRIHHDNAGNSYIVEGGVGNLFIMADHLRIQDASGNNKLTTSATGVSIPQTLDVDGDTQLDDLNVAGVATFSSNINANGNIIGDDSTNISGINSVTAR